MSSLRPRQFGSHSFPWKTLAFPSLDGNPYLATHKRNGNVHCNSTSTFILPSFFFIFLYGNAGSTLLPGAMESIERWISVWLGKLPNMPLVFLFSSDNWDKQPLQFSMKWNFIPKYSYQLLSPYVESSCTSPIHISLSSKALAKDKKRGQLSSYQDWRCLIYTEDNKGP